MIVALPSPESVPLELLGHHRIRPRGPRLLLLHPDLEGADDQQVAGAQRRLLDRHPLTSTPLVLLRSWTVQPSASRRISAW